MGLAVAAEGNERDVFAAGARDVAAADHAPAVGEEDDLQQDGGGVRRSAGLVVAIVAIESRQFIGHFVVDEMVQGVLEGAGLELLFEDDGQQERTGINGLVAGHGARQNRAWVAWKLAGRDAGDQQGVGAFSSASLGRSSKVTARG